MQNYNLKAVIYLTMVTLVSLMSVGCGPTEKEYMAKIDEVNRYKRLSKQRQTEIENMAEKNAGDYYLKITNLEQKERELQEKYQKFKEDEKALNAQVDSHDMRLLEEQTTEKNAKQRQQELLESLRNQLESDKINITELSNRIAVRLDEQLLFDSGQAFIKSSGFKVLKRIGGVLKKIHDKHIQVEGHTDNLPIGGILKRKYSTNWELSIARATSVIHYLIDEVKIEPTRISATGFGEFQAIAENNTPEGRQANRRVEFALLPLRSNAGD